MADRIVITDRQDKPRYIAEGDEVRPHPDHEHLFFWGRRCWICNKTRKELEQEST